MLNSSTVYLVGFVSEIVFALTLSLLAWKDRRMRGMTWFAASVSLQFVCTAVRSHSGSTFGGEWLGAGDCVLVLSFFFIYMGLRWFTLRRPLASQVGPIATSLAMTLVLLVSAFNQSAARFSERVACICIIGAVVPLLRNPRVPGMRQTARIAALLLAVLSAIFLFRSGIEAVAPRMMGGVVDLWARMATLIVANALSFSFVAFYLAESQRRLHEETRMDVLTGLRNRRAMEEIAIAEVRSAARQGAALSLLLIDADHFKKLNDTWGHAVGDRALRIIGEALDQCHGCVARVGGEEFAVLLPRTRMEAAAEVGETLCRAVNEAVLLEGSHRVLLSVSIGVSALRGGERNWLDMLRRADKALYRAKHEGRNRVSMWRESDSEASSSFDSRLSKWRRVLSGSSKRTSNIVAEAEPSSSHA